MKHRIPKASLPRAGVPGKVRKDAGTALTLNGASYHTKTEGTLNADEPDEVYLNEHQVAELLNISVLTVRRWRVEKRHLPYTKIGKNVRYPKSGCIEYANSRMVQVA